MTAFQQQIADLSDSELLMLKDIFEGSEEYDVFQDELDYSYILCVMAERELI